MNSMDHKSERASDIAKIKDSSHPRKIIVAGPGTGKSHLFTELIKKKKAEGKSKFLAITFIGKLGDALADDLCGLAETMTMHGLARRIVFENWRGWNYYPQMSDLIGEDLRSEGTTEFQIGDETYKNKSEYYRAVGDDDVVQYAIQILKQEPTKIPNYDLILVDEYQDFNTIESELVDLLAVSNDMVIVGDDDQALYEFKGSSPEFIRHKYDKGNTHFESHTLRFCSRCTEVIIKSFHGIVAKYSLSDPAKQRIRKDYICYLPDKADDSSANQKIHLISKCPPGMIAYKIHQELRKLVINQKIKDVLIIGDGRSCVSLLNSIAVQLKNYGFENIDHKASSKLFKMSQKVVDAYKLITKDKSSLLGWRILDNPTDENIRAQHIKNSKNLNTIIGGTPSELRAISQTAITELENEIEDPIIQDKTIHNSVLFSELKRDNSVLNRPLRSLDITICNILNSKGLGADVVFLVGFDKGRFPVGSTPTDSEVYQLLVAITRAKKRLYLINTVGKTVSDFSDCVDVNDLELSEVEVRQ